MAASRREIKKAERQRRRRTAVLAVFSVVALMLALVGVSGKTRASNVPKPNDKLTKGSTH